MKAAGVTAAWLVIVVTGCGRVDDGPGSIDTIAWRADSIVRSLPGCADSTVVAMPAEAPCAEVHLGWIVPTDTSRPAVAESISVRVDRILLAMGERVAASREALAEEFLAAYREFRADVPGAAGGWFEQRIITVACNTPATFTLRTDFASHTGGAHPNSATLYSSIDAQSGRSVGWRDRTDTIALRQVAEKAFRKHHALPDSGSLNEQGWQFADDRFSLPSEGMRCGDSLTLHYNPYEVGPYAAGVTELVIPAAGLEPRR